MKTTKNCNGNDFFFLSKFTRKHIDSWNDSRLGRFIWKLFDNRRSGGISFTI